ncbi:MAG: thioredoxin family protein [Magnetococcales bacterium]|nr:thioredoxin family protein [Magnetococcales bacterium]
MLTEAPSALLWTASGCHHCEATQRLLTQLLAEGTLASLECLDVRQHVQQAESLAIHSVPTVTIGPFLFQGSHPLSEWRRWAMLTQQDKGVAVYFDHLFTIGQRHRVEWMIRRYPDWIMAFIDLLADPQVGINSRLGIGAVLEELQGTSLTAALVAPLGQLAQQHDQARIRGDACYYLALLGWPDKAAPYWQQCLNDPDATVVEIAREYLDELAES